MMCAWQQLLNILPGWLAGEVDMHEKKELQEIRLRLGTLPELKTAAGNIWLNRGVSSEDLSFVVNAASRYSPWTAATVAQGFLTAAGGHRIGLCGDAVIKNGSVDGIRQIHSLCIRIARDYPGIGTAIGGFRGSILILGPPGSGKTTLLRDVLRVISATQTVCVVDERGELFPESFTRGKRMDVLKGSPKAEGIDMVLRSMGPECIGVDEITSEQDCEGLVRAGWCGVRLIATAHASSLADLKSRPVYRQLYRCHLFDHIVVLNRDKSWHEERMVV